MKLLQLNDEQLEYLCNHMGHDVKVHRHFYRLHDNALEVSKVAKLLLAVDGGQIHHIAGKDLDTITLDGNKNIVLLTSTNFYILRSISKMFQISQTALMVHVHRLQPPPAVLEDAPPRC